MEIRDPVHGPVAVSAVEVAVVDSPWFQRLRSIKQLGFSEQTFPGASHTRFLHSIGAMHLAGKAFDAVFRNATWLTGDDRERLRQTLRLAALCHDLGHPPLSHTSEVLLAPLALLKVPHLTGPMTGKGSHEHYTLKLLLDSGLTETVSRVGKPMGIEPLHIAGLLHAGVNCPASAYEVAGRDLRGVLSSLISSEIDVDRMDYLLRDSYYTGVSYGQFDADWLIGHLTHYEASSGSLHLALHERALFAFDDFMLSRHHMFLMVYFHKKSVCYDHMLRHFYDEFPDLCRAPTDPDLYLEFDDPAIWRALREKRKSSWWAEGILGRRPLKLIAESTPSGRQEPIAALAQRLEETGIAHIQVTSQGALSKYHAADRARAIFVRKQPVVGEPYHLPLMEATRLFERYADHTLLQRVYVDPAEVDRASRWLLELRAPILAT